MQNAIKQNAIIPKFRDYRICKYSLAHYRISTFISTLSHYRITALYSEFLDGNISIVCFLSMIL